VPSSPFEFYEACIDTTDELLSLLRNNIRSKLDIRSKVDPGERPSPVAKTLAKIESHVSTSIKRFLSTHFLVATSSVGCGSLNLHPILSEFDDKLFSKLDEVMYLFEIYSKS
jgi:hypothetical protein